MKGVGDDHEHENLPAILMFEFAAQRMGTILSSAPKVRTRPAANEVALTGCCCRDSRVQHTLAQSQDTVA